MIVKDGPRPVRVRGSREAFEVDVPRLPGVADSTGAGDAFAAGYLAATIRGERIREAVTAGIDLAATAAASLAAQHDGDREPGDGVVEGSGQRVAVELE